MLWHWPPLFCFFPIPISFPPTLQSISSVCIYFSNPLMNVHFLIAVMLCLISPFPNPSIISSSTMPWSHIPLLLFFYFFIMVCLLFHFSPIYPLSQGNVTFSCSESQPVVVTFLSATTSFLVSPTDWAAEGLSVRLQFRTWNQDGRLLTVPLSQGPKSSSLILQLSGGGFLLTLRGVPQVTAQISTGEKNKYIY